MTAPTEQSPFSAPAAYQAPQPPKRSWVRRHKVLTAIGAFVLVAGIGGAAGAGHKGSTPVAGAPAVSTNDGSSSGSNAPGSTSPGSNSSTSSTGSNSSSSNSVAPTYGSATFPQQDGDWRADSLTVSSEQFTGDFSGTARITYTGSDSSGNALNNFTITVFKNKQVVGTLIGTIDAAMPGQTKTVTLISTDKFVSGAKTYEFQKDF
jgi:hypothetical protein